MKRVVFSTGDKVVTVKDGELRKGVIKTFYPINPPVFVIKFEDGSVEKVLYNAVAPAPEADPPEEVNKPVEKSEVTITPDDFKKISCRAVVKWTKDHEGIDSKLVAIMGEMYRALFLEPLDD